MTQKEKIIFYINMKMYRRKMNFESMKGDAERN
jgi:hypothetical protein